MVFDMMFSCEEIGRRKEQEKEKKRHVHEGVVFLL